MHIIIYKKKKRKKKIIKIIQKSLGLLQFGYFGLKSIGFGILQVKQVENIRYIFTRISKKIGSIFMRIYFQHPVTIKPLLSRMGKGSGILKFWISYIKKGIIFLEMAGLEKKIALKIFNKISTKLGFKTQFIIRQVFTSK